MVVDTSALAAIFFGEPERPAFVRAMFAATVRLISAATLFEAGLVIESRQGDSASREFDLFVIRTGLEVIPVDAEQAELARAAWRRYGKGRHPAALNFGDCFSYALSKLTGEPLLAKGKDFVLTDIELHS